MNAQASATSAWYAAVVNPATPPSLRARCRIRCARGMPCAAASAFNRARSASVTLSLISGIFGALMVQIIRRTQKPCPRLGSDASGRKSDAKKPVIPREDAKSGFSLSPPIRVFCSPRYIPPLVSVPDLIYPYLRPNRRKGRQGLGFCVRNLRPTCVRPGRNLRPTSRPQVQLETQNETLTGLA